MTIHLSIVLWLPAAAGLLGAARPARRALDRRSPARPPCSPTRSRCSPTGTPARAAFSTSPTRPGSARSASTTSSAINGLNLVLILTTCVVFFASALWTALRQRDLERPGLYVLLMGVAQSGVTGAFMAQDLALFVVFFDLMLVPFYFLTLIWGGPDRAAGGAEAVHLHARRLAADARRRDRHRRAREGGPGRLDQLRAQRPRARDGSATGSQHWIFLVFAAAFLIKMPSFPFHGWMPDGYMQMPIPVLAAFSVDPLEGRRLRLHRDRAAAVPAGRARVPGAADADRAGVDPLRVGDGVHAEPGAARARLLVARAARLHHARDLRPQRARRRRRAAAGGQPRARDRRADLRRSRCSPSARRAARTSATWAASRRARRCSRRCS